MKFAQTKQIYISSHKANRNEPKKRKAKQSNIEMNSETRLSELNQRNLSQNPIEAMENRFLQRL